MNHVSRRQRTRGFGFLLALILASLGGLVVASSAGAAAMGSAAFKADFLATVNDSTAVEILYVINDEGSDPATSYTEFQPTGNPGSSASSLASVTLGPDYGITFSATASSTAAGVPQPDIEVVTSRAALEAGFYIINTTDSEVFDVTLTVNWGANIDVAAGGSPIDLAIGQVFIDLVLDDTPLRIAALEADSPPGASLPTSRYLTSLQLAPNEVRLVTLALTAIAVAQSTVPAMTVPEPGTVALMCAGLVAIAALGARRRSQVRG